jgi:hypothetical protein
MPCPRPPSDERQGDKRLAGGDPDAQLGAFRGRELADRQGCPDRTLGVVLMGDRGAEQGHDGIADELLDGPPMSLQLHADLGVEARQEGTHILGVQPLGTRRGAHEVAEQDGDDLAFLAHGGRRHSEGGTAHPA